MKSGLVLAVLMFGISLGPSAAAAEARLTVQATDSVKTVLERQVKRTATLKLRTGDELTGTVTAVGDKLVHLSALAGKEFYDAVVALDAVAAVVVRARDK